MVGELSSRAVHAGRTLELRVDDLGSLPPTPRGGPSWPAVERTCQRLLSELFDEQTAARRTTRGHTSTSTFAELSPRLQACTTHNHAPLAPSQELDACLTRLVELLRFEPFDRVPPRPSDRAHAPGLAHPPGRAARQQQFDLEVSQQLVACIRRDPRRSEQARVIRKAAALAESAMEHHYSKLVVAALESRQRAHATQAVLAAGRDRTRALLGHLSPFPYGLSYARLVAAELQLLTAPAQPLLLRDRELARLDPSARQTIERVRAELAQRVPPASFAPCGLDGLRDQVIAVCGAGPLPVTGLMLHTESDADVVLIDHDETSVAQAARLVLLLERQGVLRTGAVSVVHGDAGALRFLPRSALSSAAGAVHCDVILVASLVNHAAKLRLARGLCADQACAPMAVLLRSAASLCGALAYEPVDTHDISTLGLPFCGESVPENLVFAQLDRDTAARRGVTCRETRELLVTAHGAVLNTTELYHRVPLPVSVAALRVSSSIARPSARFDADPEGCLRVLTDLRNAPEAP